MVETRSSSSSKRTLSSSSSLPTGGKSKKSKKETETGASSIKKEHIDPPEVQSDHPVKKDMILVNDDDKTNVMEVDAQLGEPVIKEEITTSKAKVDEGVSNVPKTWQSKPNVNVGVVWGRLLSQSSKDSYGRLHDRCKETPKTMKYISRLFPNKVTIQTPQDEALLSDWKQQFDRDTETLKSV